MANLKEIRTRITSVESTMQITSAMKMVSAAKLKRAQDAITQMRPFAKKFNEILLNVSGSVEGGDHPLMKKNNGKKVLLIALSSNGFTLWILFSVLFICFSTSTTFESSKAAIVNQPTFSPVL